MVRVVREGMTLRREKGKLEGRILVLFGVWEEQVQDLVRVGT